MGRKCSRRFRYYGLGDEILERTERVDSKHLTSFEHIALESGRGAWVGRRVRIRASMQNVKGKHSPSRFGEHKPLLEVLEIIASLERLLEEVKSTASCYHRKAVDFLSNERMSD